MRSRGRRPEVSGWRVLCLLALAVLVLYVVVDRLEPDGPPERGLPPDPSLEYAFFRLGKADAQRRYFRDKAFRALRRDCAERRKPPGELREYIRKLGVHFDPRSEEAAVLRQLEVGCLRREFGEFVRLLREAPEREEEALSRIFHYECPDGIEPDYEFVWIHLQSDRREEAAKAAAEAVAAREEAGAPDLAVHLQLYAWLLNNAGRRDEARAVEERALRLAENPPPAREPEGEEQAADDAGPG